MDSKMIDAVFKLRYEELGGHTHCSLFSALRPDATYAKCGDFVIRNEEFVALRQALSGVEFVKKVDPRDPDPSREGIFKYHNCWRCKDGQEPCVQGHPYRCEYPRARND